MIPAGRELDALIAEKVMGWNHSEYSPIRHRCDGKFHTKCGACGKIGHGNCYGDGSGPVQIECDCTPHYSSSIADAWLVVEAAKLFTERQYVLSNEVDWIISEEVSPAGAYGIIGKAPTIAHCICLAALKAVGVDV